MHSGFAVLSATAVAACALALGASAQPAPVNLTGTWKGTGHDTFVRHNAPDGMQVTWVLSQTGSTVLGTVVTKALVPSDGSCSSCHRAKSGTVSGVISGTSLTLTMHFPGGNGEVTAACVAHYSGTASGLGGNTLTALYSASDSCEDVAGISYADGTLDMARVFSDDPLTIRTTVVRAMHGAELRARIDVQRARFGLLEYAYTDPTLGAGTGIRAQHITELRHALAEVYLKAEATPPIYTDDPLTAGTPIKAVHISEVRAALIGIE